MNHSVNFVDPTTKVNTQQVESYWNRITNTYTGQLRKHHWHILQQYSIVRLHINSHFPEKKLDFHKF